MFPVFPVFLSWISGSTSCYWWEKLQEHIGKPVVFWAKKTSISAFLSWKKEVFFSSTTVEKETRGLRESLAAARFRQHKGVQDGQRIFGAIAVVEGSVGACHQWCVQWPIFPLEKAWTVLKTTIYRLVLFWTGEWCVHEIILLGNVQGRLLYGVSEASPVACLHDFHEHRLSKTAQFFTGKTCFPSARSICPLTLHANLGFYLTISMRRCPSKTRRYWSGLDPYFEDIHCDIDILEYKDLSYPQTILSFIEVRCYILGCRLT